MLQWLGQTWAWISYRRCPEEGAVGKQTPLQDAQCAMGYKGRTQLWTLSPGLSFKQLKAKQKWLTSHTPLKTKTESCLIILLEILDNCDIQGSWIGYF